jgi:iron(III) transport system ATP-binding protein
MAVASTPCGAGNAVDIIGVAQTYGSTPVLRRIDLALESGNILALLGPSGCGKTTLLRLVAGLLMPSEGSIRLAGVPVADPVRRIFVPPERRGLGMVFQDYALWPHLTVGANVAFPLEMRGLPRAERAKKIAAALARVGLAGFEDRNPGSLSGGQQQRVAIARAIVAAPRLVLFDEPLSNLDKELRESLVGEIGVLVRELGLTAIYVTHDHGEAFALADGVAIMRAGRIEQLAAPEELVDRPAGPGVAELLNLGPIARAEARADGWWLTPAGFRLAGREEGPPNGAATADVLLARKAFSLRPAGAAALTGIVTRSQFRGDQHLVTVRLGSPDSAVDIDVASECRASAGESVGLAVEPARLRWFLTDPSHDPQTETTPPCAR